ncbi:MAG: hypothetical protein MUF20_08035 [Methylotetracoccus sp.]|nr:hypothetical protein [Methylotetracoccus sp.]
MVVSRFELSWMHVVAGRVAKQLLVALGLAVSGVASAGVEFPWDAGLPPEIGAGVEVDAVTPNGSPGALKQSVLADIEAKHDSTAGGLSWNHEIQESLMSMTRSTSVGARASGAFSGLGAAARYNRVLTDSRTDSNIYVSVYMRFMAKRTYLARNGQPYAVTATSNDSVVPEVRELRQQLVAALESDRAEEVRRIRRQFRQRFGTGLLQQIDFGAFYQADYSEKASDKVTAETVSRAAKLTYGAQSSAVSKTDGNVQAVSQKITESSGKYHGPLIPGLSNIMTVKAAIQQLDPVSEATGDASLVKSLIKQPSPLRYHYLAYSEIPYLQVFADPDEAQGATAAGAGVVEYFGDAIPGSAAFLVARTGWNSEEVLAVAALVPYQLDLLDVGHLGITYRIDTEPFRACPMAPGSAPAEMAGATSCAENLPVPSRVARWQVARDGVVTDRRALALATRDPGIRRGTVLSPRLLRIRQELPESSWHELLPAIDGRELRGVTMGDIESDVIRGGSGFRVVVELPDRVRSSVLEAIADGQVAVQTVVQLPSGEVHVLRARPIGPVSIPSAGTVKLPYSLVPLTEQDLLVEKLNGELVDFAANNSRRIYKSGCSDALVVGSELCTAQITVEPNPTGHTCGRLELDDLTGCVRWIRQVCRYGSPALDENGNWRPGLFKKHVRRTGSRFALGHTVIEADCRNQRTEEVVVPTPLPTIETGDARL